MSYATQSEIDSHVYVQASEWVRFGNLVLWITGFLFLPLSLGALALAIVRSDPGMPHHLAEPAILAAVSLLLYLMWVQVSRLYRVSVMDARRTLCAIEVASEIPVERRLYDVQKQPSMRGFALPRVQAAGGGVLLALWIACFAFLFGG